MNVDLLPFERYLEYWVLLGFVGAIFLIVALGHFWPRFTVCIKDDDGQFKDLKSNIDRDDHRIVKRRKKRLKIGLINAGIVLIIATVFAVSAFTGRIAAMQDLDEKRNIAYLGEKISKTVAEPLSDREINRLWNRESVAVEVVDKDDNLHKVNFKYSEDSSLLGMLGGRTFAPDETVEGFVTAGKPWTETAESQAEGMFRHDVASKLEARYGITLPPENRKELQIPSERPSEGFKEFGSTNFVSSDEYTGYKRLSAILIWEGEFKLISESPDGSNIAELNKQGSSVTFLN